MTKIELFWDVGSPYTYLAVTQVEALRRRTGAEVVLRPFLLGGVFKSTGNTMPAEIPAKAIYMMEDLRRWAAHYGVPIKLPPDVSFPLNTLLPMRAAVAADQRGAGERFCNALFAAYWGEGRDVSGPDEVARIASSVGLDGPGIVEATATPAVKDELRANTDEAVRRGAFGAPAFFVGDALFWGNDRIELVERAVRGG